MTDSNDLVINEFRAHGGRVDIGGFGTNLVLIHSLGARSGVERVHPVAPLRDGHDWLIVASTGGSPTNPRVVLQPARPPRHHHRNPRRQRAS
jgi:hypothetical protein